MESVEAIVSVVANAGVQVTTTVATMEPGRFDFSLSKGAPLSFPVSWYVATNKEYANCTAASFIVRADPTSTTALLTLTQASGITVQASQPSIKVALNTAGVDDLVTAAGTSIAVQYWLYGTDDYGSRCLLRGTLTLRP